MPDREFERLLGTPIPDGHWSGTLQMNDALCQMYYARSLKARLIYKLLTKKIDDSIRAGKPDVNLLFAYNMPFRALGKISGGGISQKMCEGLLIMANGHAAAFFKGLTVLISGIKEQRKNLEKDKLYQAEKA